MSVSPLPFLESLPRSASQVAVSPPLARLLERARKQSDGKRDFRNGTGHIRRAEQRFIYLKMSNPLSFKPSFPRVRG
jgi:hypothetical protein